MQYKGYFDYAAATPLDEEVLAAMQPFFSERFFNPSALYQASREVKYMVEEARAEVAAALGVRPAEIIFTAGGSEANNLAITGIMQGRAGANCVISQVEHDSVHEPASIYDCRVAKVNAAGEVDITDLISKIDDDTTLVSVIYANNEIGTIQPIKQISQALQQIKVARKQAGNSTPLYFHTDAAQAGNYLDLQAHRLGVDLLSINGGKIYGPKQTGALYVRGGTTLKPIILGGGQERGHRSGTENVAGVVGFSLALKKAVAARKASAAEMAMLQRYFWQLLAEKIPTASLNGHKTRRLPNNVHFTLEGTDNERLLILLDDKGFMAAAGSACSASKQEPSRILAAIGLSEPQIRSSLRFSMGKYTTKEDIARLVESLSSLLA